VRKQYRVNGVCEPSFEDLFINNSSTIHQPNLKRLSIEIYKTEINVNPAAMNSIFRFLNLHMLLEMNHFSLKSKYSYGTEADVIRFGKTYLRNKETQKI